MRAQVQPDSQELRARLQMRFTSVRTSLPGERQIFGQTCHCSSLGQRLVSSGCRLGKLGLPSVVSVQADAPLGPRHSECK